MLLHPGTSERCPAGGGEGGIYEVEVPSLPLGRGQSPAVSWAQTERLNLFFFFEPEPPQ